MLKFTFGGVPVEIWFAPSFSIKTTDKRIEMLFRKAKIETYDPLKKKIREVRPSRSEFEAYLYLEEIKNRVPELKIELEEYPPLPTSRDKENKDAPILE
ncbi:hypothetical protein E5Z46_18775 [Geobacillus kaustophilus NBRC 102445]|uniref:hypothetical protein n=1 Tax=Geobacillus kaustophilus TaxID=1462 RepID=UPI0010BF578D|nr:hypothetical protein [Geobacillus kaustophilus]QCK84062.1 hypothetical protein E5Z46_18775 [Geobacillus kaustophilus NBRC 102445]QHB48411.1 hypothetical protein GBK1_4 [Geobacillus phage GBK1]